LREKLMGEKSRMENRGNLYQAKKALSSRTSEKTRESGKIFKRRKTSGKKKGPRKKIDGTEGKTRKKERQERIERIAKISSPSGGETDRQEKKKSSKVSTHSPRKKWKTASIGKKKKLQRKTSRKNTGEKRSERALLIKKKAIGKERKKRGGYKGNLTQKVRKKAHKTTERLTGRGKRIDERKSMDQGET